MNKKYRVLFYAICIILFSFSIGNATSFRSKEVGNISTNQVRKDKDRYYKKKPVDYTLIDTITIYGDLNHDKKKDKIKIKFWGEEFEKNTSNYYFYIYSLSITINDQKQSFLFDFFSMDSPDIQVVDININDSFSELAISSVTEGLGGKTYFFRWKNNSILYLGSLEGTMHPYAEELPPLIINGDNIILSPERAFLLHTFEYYVPYKLDSKTNMLKKTPTTIYNYWQPHKTKILRNFKAFQKKDIQSSEISLHKGETIHLIATDGEKWIQFKNAKGEKGWIFAIDDNLIFNYGKSSDYLSDMFFYG